MKKLLVGLVAVVFCVSLMWGCDESKTPVAVVEADVSSPLLNNIGGGHLWVGKILQSTDDCSEDTDTLDWTSPDISLSKQAIKFKYCGLRFDGSPLIGTVGQVDSAFLKISKARRSCALSSGCSFFIYGVKEVDPPTWGSSQKPSDVTPTIDTVSATVTDLCGVDVVACLTQQSYDVTDIVTEIIELSGYDSSFAVSLVLQRDNFCGSCWINWQSFDFVPDGGSAGDCSAILEVYNSR